MKNKLLIVFLFITLFCFTVSVSAMTDQERQALIAQLQAQIAALQAQLVEMIRAQQSDSSWCYTFNETLIQGNSGPGVYALQVALQKSGYIISSSEMTATLFGTSTKDAVVKFQQKYSSEILAPYGYISGTGIVGLMTRTKLNNLYGCTGAVADDEEQITNAKCNSDYDCGNTGFTGDAFCSSGSVYQTYTTYTCKNAGKSNAYCSVGTTYKSRDVCSASETCSNGSCVAKEDNTASCTPNWNCNSWSSCVNNQQVRSCYDTNYCGVTSGAPAQTQSCITIDQTTCTPNWSCGSWTACSFGYQTRFCYDTNYCGNTTNKPSEQQNCVSACTPNWSCGSWSSCVNSQQTRYCYDTNYCGSEANKPNDYQSCTSNTNGSLSVDLKINGVDGPITVAKGSTVSVVWSSTDINSCSASASPGNTSWSGTKATSGIASVVVSTTGIYYLKCTDTNGSTVEDNVVINVVAVDLKINGQESLTLPYRSTTPLTLTWSSSGVNSCNVSSTNNDSVWSGTKASSGSQALGLIPTYSDYATADGSVTYSITCTNTEGNAATDRITLTITHPTATLKIGLSYGSAGAAPTSDGPLYRNYGDYFALGWTSTNATICTKTATEPGSVYSWTQDNTTSGSFFYGQALFKSTYTITCRDSMGNAATDTVELRVCNESSYGAIGFLDGVYGSYPNTCDANNRQAITYKCDDGRVVRRYQTCTQRCSGGKCTEIYYLPG